MNEQLKGDTRSLSSSANNSYTWRQPTDKCNYGLGTNNISDASTYQGGANKHRTYMSYFILNKRNHTILICGYVLTLQSHNMQVKPFRDDSTPSGSSTWPGLDHNRSQVHLKHNKKACII
jgi:hypothetical protein